MESIILKFAGKIITGLKLAAGSVVSRAMAALGLTWVNMAYALPAVKEWVASKFSGLSSEAMNIISLCGADIAITLVISAIVARIGMRTFLAMTSSLQGMINLEPGT